MVGLSSIFLSPSVSIELFLEFFLLIILSYTFIQSIIILRSYKKESIAEIQSFVEKKSYLVSILVSVSLLVKVVLLLFFVYALDELASIVPGAMCVTGVLNTNEYGEVLLVLKLVLLLFASLWLLLHKADLHSNKGIHFKKKMIFFLLLYIGIFLEFILSITFFSSIDTQLPVSCCSVKYIELTSSLPFNLSIQTLVSLFYALYILLIVSAYKKKKIILFLSTLIFVYISYYVIVYYFGGFIYGDSSHHCPYCMLKQEYSYVGYFIYISLFISVFYSFGFVIFDAMKYAYKPIILWYSFFVLVLTSKLFF